MFKENEGSGQPWCSIHQMHPASCFIIHNPKLCTHKEGGDICEQCASDYIKAQHGSSS